jgi:hypothetical protein
MAFYQIMSPAILRAPNFKAGFCQYSRLGNSPAGINVLVAAARYLAAHTPTMRSQEQTYQMAYRLHRGDRLFEEGE